MVLVSGKSFEGLKKQEFQQILGSYFYVVLSCLCLVRLEQVMNEQDWKLRESLQGAKTYVIRCHFCNFIIWKNVFYFLATIPVIDDKDDYWWLLTKNMINEKKCMSTFLISKTDISLAGNFSCKGRGLSVRFLKLGLRWQNVLTFPPFLKVILKFTFVFD